MRQSEFIALASVAIIGVGALLFGRYVADTLERALEQEARQKLTVLGFSDIEVDADGLVLALSGRVRTERDHAILQETFGAMEGVTGVIDRVAVVSPPIDLRPTLLVVQKDGASITLSGETPDVSTRDILVSKARMANGGATLLNLLKAQDRGEPPANWLAAAEAAIEAVAALRAGRATVERDLLKIEGAAENAEAKAAVERRLRANVGALIALELDIESPPPFLSPYVFRAQKRGDGVTVTRCAAPDAQTRSVILGALTATGQAARPDPADTPCQIATGALDAWADAASRGLQAIAGLEEAEIAIVDDRVRVIGFVKEGVDVDVARQAIGRGWPENYKLSLDIRKVFPLASPFQLTAVKRPGEVTLKGSAPSLERAEAWSRRLAAANELSLARGAPAEFGAAATIVIDALAELKIGEATLRDTDFVLSAPGDASERAALAQRLARALPAGYRIRVEAARAPSALVGAAPAAPGAAGDPARADRFVFTARRYASGSTEIAGVVGDGAVRAIVQAYARAKLGGDQLSVNLSLRDAAQPVGWQRSLFAGLDALSELDEGEVTVEKDAIYLRGVVDAAAKVRLASRTLEAKTPTDYTRFSRITVAEPDPTGGAAAAGPLTAAACVAALNRVVSTTPIAFDSGRANIRRESLEQLEALAATLLRCPDARIEVGGHTDRSGPADANLALSRRRAAAVKRNLEARGASAAQLTAVGYGETRPLTQDDTDAARARNRRIEFKLAP